MRIMWTYGFENLDPNKFIEVSNKNVYFGVKPENGLYGSPDKYAWLEFCVNGLPKNCKDRLCIDISSLNILKIENKEDVKKLIEKYLIFNVSKDKEKYLLNENGIQINFEKIAKDYDAFEIGESISFDFDFRMYEINLKDSLEQIQEASIYLKQNFLKGEIIELPVDDFKNFLKEDVINFESEKIINFGLYDIPTICVLTKDGFNKLNVIEKEKVTFEEILKVAENKNVAEEFVR